MTHPERASQGTLLTVVMPVYNLESCVGDALQSILKQQRYLDDITVLVVDDGSTDNSRARIEEIVRANPHVDIRLIAQVNGGCSAARNTGIAQAQSPYLAFLDGDDTWEADFLEKIIPILREGRADIVEYNIWIVGRTGKQSDELTMIGPTLAGERPIDEVVLLDFAKMYQTFAWARVYRRELWRDIVFPPSQLYEDAAVVPGVYLRARVTHRLTARLYNYYRRAGSITQVMTPRSVRDLVKNAENALANCGDARHGAFWMVISGMAFAHAVREAARVDGPALSESLQMLDALVKRCRTLAAQYPALPDYVAYERFRSGVYKERAVFLAKRLIKRLIRRERREVRAVAPPVKPKRSDMPALQDDH
jgi:glycosyltransferase involved in cell wall biosynthesis